MTERSKIVIGTRGSSLALWQTHWISRELIKLYPDLKIELRTVKTTGDKILDSPLSKIGDKGLFTKELEQLLLKSEIDLAVHSLKDMPTMTPKGLAITAVTEREDVRDVFISHPQKHIGNLRDVPKDGTIATGSLRRKCQLLKFRPDFQIADIRGNLESRIRKLTESAWDGMLLAKAGVTRLGYTEIISQVLPPSLILPAVGQGALAVETRTGDAYLTELLQPLNHDETRLATTAERSLLRRLEGGCQIPIGAFGRIENNRLKLDSIVGSIDGQRSVESSIEGVPAQAEELGIELAERLIAMGAGEILKEIRSENV